MIKLSVQTTLVIPGLHEGAEKAAKRYNSATDNDDKQIQGT